MDTTAGVQLKNSLDATSLSPQQLWEAGICRPVLFKRNEGSKRLEKKKKKTLSVVMKLLGRGVNPHRRPSASTACLLIQSSAGWNIVPLTHYPKA